VEHVREDESSVKTKVLLFDTLAITLNSAVGAVGAVAAPREDTCVQRASGSCENAVVALKYERNCIGPDIACRKRAIGRGPCRARKDTQGFAFDD